MLAGAQGLDGAYEAARRTRREGDRFGSGRAGMRQRRNTAGVSEATMGRACLSNDRTYTLRPKLETSVAWAAEQ